MNITEVKEKLGVGQLNMSIDYKTDDKGKVIEPKEETGWLRMWDNDNRVAIVMHKDVAEQIKNNQNPNLGIKDDLEKTGPQGPYVMRTIVAYTPVAYNF